MIKILVRRDDPEQQIELVRWQETLRGWWGMTATMLANHRAPCLFPNIVWQEISVEGTLKTLTTERLGEAAIRTVKSMTPKEKAKLRALLDFNLKIPRNLGRIQ